ncbi:MAG: endonuclease V [Leptospiraceae bacterium]|nr:endonuclease V [Leptospiraceae bacterium]MDW7976605.1 endonuclease V [Leptospiraceae bacterium]
MKSPIRKSSLFLLKKAIEEYQQEKSLRLAQKIQNQYAKVVLKQLPKWKNLQPSNNLIVAGIDVAIKPNTQDAIAGIVILDSHHKIFQQYYVKKNLIFPYIPGFLSFREVEILIELFENIHIVPDVLFIDGQGIAHPRFVGIAVHLGIILNLPTIGVGKTKLIGQYKNFALKKGNYEKLIYKNTHIGWAVCTRDDSQPIFVSPGWKVSMTSALELTLAFSKYKIPEPTRIAHNYVNSVRKSFFG